MVADPIHEKKNRSADQPCLITMPATDQRLCIQTTHVDDSLIARSFMLIEQRTAKHRRSVAVTNHI